MQQILMDLQSFVEQSREQATAFRTACGGIARGLADWVEANPTRALPYTDETFALIRGMAQTALDKDCPGWVAEVDAGEARHKLLGLPRVTVRKAIEHDRSADVQPHVCECGDCDQK